MRKLLILSIFLVFPTVAHAQSADDPLKGFYVDLRAGGSFLSNADNTGPGLTTSFSVETDYDAGFVGEGAFGYEFDNGIRGEIALGYARYRVDQLTVTSDGGIGNAFGIGSLNGLTLDGDGDVSGFTFMLNGYYGFDLGDFRPYVGAGIGGAYVSADISALAQKIVDDSDTVLAYQGIVGLEYVVTDDARLGLRYSYFATQDPTFEDTAGVKFDGEVQSHNIMATVRFLL